MLTDGLILGMLASIGLAIVGYKMRSLPVMFISSLGWLISALQVFSQTSEVLPMALLLMLSVSQFFLISSKEVR